MNWKEDFIFINDFGNRQENSSPGWFFQSERCLKMHTKMPSMFLLQRSYMYIHFFFDCISKFGWKLKQTLPFKKLDDLMWKAKDLAQQLRTELKPNFKAVYFLLELISPSKSAEKSEESKPKLV